MDNIETEYDGRNWMDTSDDKVSDKRDQISKNDEERVNDDIEVSKLGKLSSKKNYGNVEKESGERNQIDMNDEKEYDERDQIDKND